MHALCDVLMTCRAIDRPCALRTLRTRALRARHCACAAGAEWDMPSVDPCGHAAHAVLGSICGVPAAHVCLIMTHRVRVHHPQTMG